MAVVRASFSALSLENIRIWLVECQVIKLGSSQVLLSLLSFFKSCGSRQGFFSRHSTLQISEFCFCSFQIPWHTVELIFSALDFDIHQNLFLLFRFFLISTTDFEKVASYFSTSNPAFFCRLIFSTSALAFSHRTLIHSAQLLLFQQ